VILAAFRTRSFRFQWPADLVTSWSFEMETLILGWYVMVTTGSVLWLTAFGSLQYLGTLAAPMYGVLGDRLGGRTVLCAMRTVYVVLAACLTLLAVTGRLTPGWVLVITTISGLVRSNDLVLRNALIAETIPPRHLLGALGLSRATQDSARVAGALSGAGLTTLIGIGGSYVIVTACYVVALGLTLGVARRPTVPDPAAVPGVAGVQPTAPSRWRDLVDGLVRVATTPELLAMMLLAFLVNLTAYPVSGPLLPYAARSVFHVDATGLGWLVASFSLGGLVGSVITVLAGRLPRPERMTFVCTALWYALLFAFGQASTLTAGLAALFTAGLVQNVAMISMTTTLLAAAGDGFRGRVMGVRMLAVYGFPLGVVAFGFLIERLGYARTVGAAAVVGLLFTLLIALRWRASVWNPARTSTAPRRI
jgi:predicted MFS family arabinose efflux permease